MLKKTLPAVLLALGLIAAYVLLARSSEDERNDPDWSEESREVAVPSEGLGVGLAAGGARPKEVDPRKGRVPVAADPRTRPRGTLILRFVGPKDELLPTPALRVYVDSVGRGGFPTRLGRYDEDARTWRFEQVPAGKVKVRLHADHIVRKVEVVPVKADSENKVKIQVQQAGAIQYDVIAYDKTRPAKVKLTLYDSQDRPTRAWYQVRSSRSQTTPRAAETITQGPEGVLLGVLPGRYRLKVVSEYDEYDEAVVQVIAGATQKVSLEVRR